MSDICIVYHSGFGHTEVIAKAIESGVNSQGCKAIMIKVPQNGEIEESQWEQLNNSGAIVFGSPTYMGSASGPFKIFMDQSSKQWFEMKWKDKIAGGFTNSMGLSGDKLSTLQQLSLLAAQHGMIWISLGEQSAQGSDHIRSADSLNRVGSSIGVMAQSENESPSVTPPKGDIQTAHNYGIRIAQACKRWND